MPQMTVRPAGQGRLIPPPASDALPSESGLWSPGSVAPGGGVSGRVRGGAPPRGGAREASSGSPRARTRAAGRWRRWRSCWPRCPHWPRRWRCCSPGCCCGAGRPRARTLPARPRSPRPRPRPGHPRRRPAPQPRRTRPRPRSRGSPRSRRRNRPPRRSRYGPAPAPSPSGPRRARNRAPGVGTGGPRRTERAAGGKGGRPANSHPPESVSRGRARRSCVVVGLLSSSRGPSPAPRALAAPLGSTPGAHAPPPAPPARGAQIHVQVVCFKEHEMLMGERDTWRERKDGSLSSEASAFQRPGWVMSRCRGWDRAPSRTIAAASLSLSHGTCAWARLPVADVPPVQDEAAASRAPARPACQLGPDCSRRAWLGHAERCLVSRLPSPPAPYPFPSSSSDWKHSSRPGTSQASSPWGPPGWPRGPSDQMPWSHREDGLEVETESQRLRCCQPAQGPL